MDNFKINSYSYIQLDFEQVQCTEQLSIEQPIVESFSSTAGQRRLRRETIVCTLESSYEDLGCTDRDKELIADLIRTLAKHDHFWFIVHAHEWKRKVKAIRHVHVLKMLETIFTNHKLQKYIATISNDATKWEMVVKDLKKKMQKAETQGQLHCYMNDFAIAIGVPVEEIQPFFLRKDWEGLLTYLIKST